MCPEPLLRVIVPTALCLSGHPHLCVLGGNHAPPSSEGCSLRSPMCPLWFGCTHPWRAGTASLYSPWHLCIEGKSELIDWVAMGGGTPTVVACDSVVCTVGIKAIVPKFMTTKRLPLFIFLPHRPQDWEYFICQTNCIFY